MSFRINWTLLGFFVLCYFLIFHHLSYHPIKAWDEALFGMRAAYMASTGLYLDGYEQWMNWGVNYNYKPPLITIVQAALMKVMPHNPELALRLPSGLAILGVVLLNFRIAYILRLGYGAAMIASIILLTCSGIVTDHVGRTGDHDAPLIFFTTLSVIAFFELLYAGSKRKEVLCLFLLILALLLGFMTKNVVGLLFAPVFLILLLKEKGSSVLINPLYWLALMILILSVVGYFLCMDRLQPGYISGVMSHTLGRYTKNLFVESPLPFTYYFERVLLRDFMPWVVLLPVGVWAIIGDNKHLKYSKFGVLCLFCVGFQVLLMSFSVSKRFWYIASVYPLLSWISAIGIIEIKKMVVFSFPSRDLIQRYGIHYLLVLIFMLPITQTLQRIMFPKNTDPREQYGYLMDKLYQQEMKDYTVLASGWPVAPFYVYYYNTFWNTDIKIKSDISELEINELIMVVDEVQKNPKFLELLKGFEVEWIDRKYGVGLYRLKEQLN